RAHPRAGSPAGAELVQFVAPPVVGSTPGAGAPEGPVLRTETRRTARTPWGLPRAAAGGAGGRACCRGTRALPAVRTAISRAGTAPGPGVAASGRGTAAAGRSGDRIPDTGEALPGLREADARGSAGRGPVAALRCAPDRGHRPPEWPVS